MSERRAAANKRLLVFSRGIYLSRFRQIFDPCQRFFDLVYLVDDDRYDADTLKTAFRDALADGQKSSDFTDGEIVDIIARCRFLRHQPPALAAKLVHAMACSVSKKLAEMAPDCIASYMVDEYMSHIVSLLAAKRGIAYFSFCASYFPGASLILADGYGRPLSWQTVDRAVAEKALIAVSPSNFRQDYNIKVAYDRARHAYMMARYALKRIYFKALQITRRDRWNIHLAQLPYLAERRNWADYPAHDMFHADWRARVNASTDGIDRKIVYLPLSYHPEATIDYWVNDKSMIDYEASILRIVDTLRTRFTVIVKEHIHMMGCRSRAFLREIASRDHVTSVNPDEISNAVLAEVDAICVGTGSPGIEAVIRDKPVFTFSDTSYWYGPSNAQFMSLSQLDAWPDMMEQAIADHVPFSHYEKVDFVRECLSCSTEIGNDGEIWPTLRTDDVAKLVTYLTTKKTTSRVG